MKRIEQFELEYSYAFVRDMQRSQISQIPRDHIVEREVDIELPPR